MSAITPKPVSVDRHVVPVMWVTDDGATCAPLYKGAQTLQDLYSRMPSKSHMLVARTALTDKGVVTRAYTVIDMYDLRRDISTGGIILGWHRHYDNEDAAIMAGVMRATTN